MCTTNTEKIKRLYSDKTELLLHFLLEAQPCFAKLRYKEFLKVNPFPMEVDFSLYLPTSLSCSFWTSWAKHQKQSKGLFTAQSFIDETFLCTTPELCSLICLPILPLQVILCIQDRYSSAIILNNSKGKGLDFFSFSYLSSNFTGLYTSSLTCFTEFWHGGFVLIWRLAAIQLIFLNLH